MKILNHNVVAKPSIPRISFIIPLMMLFSCGQEKEHTSPEVKDIIEAVYSSGEIKASHQYQAYSPASGIITGFYVNSGEPVKKGDLICVIQNGAKIKKGSSSELLDIAYKNTSRNSPALSEHRLKIENAKEQYINDSIAHEREKKLYENKAASKVALEAAQLKMTLSRNNYRSEKSNYAKTVSRLNEALQKAKNNYELSKMESNDASLQSLVNGKVYKLYKNEGEMVTPQEPIALLGDSTDLILSLMIDERDIAKINPGKLVYFTTDIFPDSIFEAKVSSVENYIEPDTRSAKVEAIITKGHQSLFVGASVEANIIINRKEKVMVIPKSYLINGDSVLLEHENEEKKVRIIKGIENLEYVEILKGLNPDSKILKI